MASYRKAKLAVDTLRSTYASRITINPKSPISRIYRHGSTSSSNPAKLISGFSPFHSVSQMPIGLGLQMSAHTKRFYRADHFIKKEPTDWTGRVVDLIAVIMLVCAGVLVLAFTVSLMLALYRIMEEVPYTKEERLVHSSRDKEKGFGEAQFQQIKAAYKDKTLPASHRDTVRVLWIAQNLINCLQTGLMPKVAARSVPPENDVDEALKALSQAEDSEVVEVLVVNEPIVNASCLPGGKIVVFTGLLDHLTTDAEIATILSHEIAHAVARHGAEMMTTHLQSVLADAESGLILRLTFSLLVELEADYIGLLLMAASGYDPRVAPGVYEKLKKLTGDSKLNGDSLSMHPSVEKRAAFLLEKLTGDSKGDSLSMHPSVKNRAEFLLHAQVMNKALFIYRESMWKSDRRFSSRQVPHSNLNGV